jgi:hypothetical protein
VISCAENQSTTRPGTQRYRGDQPGTAAIGAGGAAGCVAATGIEGGNSLDPTTRRLIALGAILAPALHSVTDVMEWVHGGFFPAQLWLNYLAFLPVPVVMLGLYAAQRPRISRLEMAGALLYGFAFVDFTHTTLLALALHT